MGGRPSIVGRSGSVPSRRDPLRARRDEPDRLGRPRRGSSRRPDIVAMNAMPTCLSLMLGLALLVAACGGAPVATPAGVDETGAPVASTVTSAAPSTEDRASTGSANEPCTILSADQAIAILGEAVGTGVAKTDTTFGNASCRYTSSASTATVALWLHPSMDRDEWDASMVKLGMTPEMALPELGEAAYRYVGRTTHRTKIAVFDVGHDFYLDIANAAHPDLAADTAVGRPATSSSPSADRTGPDAKNTRPGPEDSGSSRCADYAFRPSLTQTTTGRSSSRKAGRDGQLQHGDIIRSRIQEGHRIASQERLVRIGHVDAALRSAWRERLALIARRPPRVGCQGSMTIRRTRRRRPRVGRPRWRAR